MNTKLKIAVVPVLPFVSNIRRSGDVLLADGIGIEIMKLFARSLNFTFELDGDNGSTFGRPDANGTWSGQVGKAQRKLVDIVLPHTNDPAWIAGLAASDLIAFGRANIFGAVGYLDSNNFAGFLTTFDAEIWYFYLILIVATVIVAAISDVLNKKLPVTKMFVAEEVLNYFWMLLSATFCEGSFKTPHSRRSQMLLGLWLIAILILTNGFFGQFKAVLMSKSEERMINSVEDLASRPEVIPFVPAETIMEGALRFSLNRDYQKVWQNIQKRKGDALVHVSKTSQKEVYQRVKNGEGVVIFERYGVMCYLMKICQQLSGYRRFYVAEEDVSYFQICFSFRQDFPLSWQRMVNSRIQRLRETGIIGKLHVDATRDFWKCEIKQYTEESSLKLSNLAPLFYLFSVILPLSCLALLGEIFSVRNFVKKLLDIHENVNTVLM